MTQRYGNIDRMNHPTWADRLKSLLHFELAVEASLPEGSLVVGLVLFGVGLKVGAQTDSTIPFVCWVALYGVGEQIDLCAGLESDAYAAHPLAVVSIMMEEMVGADEAAAILRGEKLRPSDGMYCSGPPCAEIPCPDSERVSAPRTVNDEDTADQCLRPCSKHPDRDGCPPVC